MLKYVLFRIAAWVVPALPLPLAYWLASASATVSYRLAARSRRNVVSNMRHVLGPGATPDTLERMARGAFYTNACNYIDFFRIPSTSAAALRARCDVINDEAFLNAYQRGKGVVFTSAHFGNMDQSIQIAANYNLKVWVLSEHVQPEALFQFVVRQRESHGVRFIPVGPRALREALQAMKRGEAVAAVADRDLQGHGLEVPFFGESASIPTGVVDLAIHTGAPLIPGFCYRLARGRFRIEFGDEIVL
ncbi:MAG: hypothetical protein AAB289_14435, partial [Chloroflexota bacterium]